MGIQSSFNQLLSLTAGGLALGKHISEESWSNKNTALEMKENINAQIDEFNAQHKEIANEQTNLRNESLDIRKKKEALSNAQEGKYTDKGAKMLESKYNNALSNLREQQLQNLKRLKDLGDRREILKERKKLYEMKTGPIKQIKGQNDDLMEKIDKYRKEGSK